MLVVSIVTHQSDLAQLAAAFASVAAQKVAHQLVVVDNDSGEEYRAALREILPPAAHLIEAQNKGYGAGHNAAFAAYPDADYYLVMNPDVVIHFGALALMLDYLAADPAIGLLAPKVLFPDGRLQPLNKRLPGVTDLFARRFLPKGLQQWPPIARRMARYEMRDVGYDAPCDVPFISGCFMLIRGEARRAVVGFNERFFMYMEDCDLTRRINAAGWRSVYVPIAVITHHWARGAHHNAKLFRVMLRSIWTYFSIWGWKL